MTLIYVPQLIETAEQAEALPDGTVLIREEHFAFQKHAGQFVSADPHDLPTGAAWEVVGWTALVPVEAKEETSVVVRNAGFQDAATHPFAEANMDSDGNVWLDNGLEWVDVTDKFNEWAKQNMRTRYVTPWEPVVAPDHGGDCA